jgi:hypothetical protein
MDLGISQTRRLYLAGAVAFPTPFPSVGTITVKPGEVSFAPQVKGPNTLLVTVESEPGFGDATTHVMLAAHVTAIFVYKGKGNKVEDFEDGEWIVGDAIKADKPERARAETPRPSRRGIVFIPEHRPVLTISECAQAAGASGSFPDTKGGCE